MPNKNVFCNSPWYELHIYWDGSLSFCCHATPNVPYEEQYRNKYNIRNMSIAEWYNSEPMKNARRRMLSDERWDYCSRCWHEEKSGSSRRHRSNQKSVIFQAQFDKSFEQSPGYDKFVNPDADADLPIDLHIDLGNYCNLACKMCGPLASSRIATQYRQWNMFNQDTTDWTQDTAVWNQFLNELLTIPKLLNLHFMGGETVIQPRFEELIDFLIANNRTDLRMSFVTNGTIYKPQLVKKLKKFTQVRFEISIESLDDTNAYQRQGTDTEEVLKNIKRYRSETNGTNILIVLRPAPSALTVKSYWQLIKYAYDNKLLIQSNLCTYPEFLAIGVLPDVYKAQYMTSYLNLLTEFESLDYGVDYNHSDPSKYKMVARDEVRKILKCLSANDPKNQEELLEQMIAHMRKWDNVYQLDARKVYPEWEVMLDVIGY